MLWTSPLTSKKTVASPNYSSAMCNVKVAKDFVLALAQILIWILRYFGTQNACTVADEKIWKTLEKGILFT